MRRARAAVGSSAVLALFLGCASCARQPGGSAEVVRHDIRGRVVEVSADRKTITLDHEEIPGVMAAMEMAYEIDPKVIEGLAAGDRVEGTLELREGVYRITRLTKR